ISFAAESTLNWKGVIFDALVNEYASIKKSLPARYQPDLERWKEALAAIVRYPAEPAQDQERSRLSEVAKSLEDAQQALLRATPRYEGLASRIGVQQIRAALPNGSAFLDFIKYFPKELRSPGQNGRWGSPRYAVFVISKEHEVFYQDLGPARTID